MTDDSYGTHRGVCRSCKQEKMDCSNDSGYCGDCD